MSEFQSLRPVPRLVTAIAIVTALVATAVARTQHRQASPDAPPATATVATANANAPAAPRGTLSAVVPASGRLTATLYDPRGTRVRVLVDGAPAARGPARLAWDGRDEQGHAMPPGRYGLKLEVRGAHVRALRMSRVRWPASAPGA